MSCESSDVVRFDLGLLLQVWIAKRKSAYNLLIIGPRGLGWQTNLQEIMGWESLVWSDLTLGPSFKVKQG